MLDLSETDAFRRHMVQILNAQIAALAACQDEWTGLWHTLLDEPDSFIETSGSAGVIYGILKAVHRRYVDPSFERVALRGIAGLMGQIGDHGQVANVSIGTECAMDRDYYRHVGITETPYGQSLSVLALTEYLLSFC